MYAKNVDYRLPETVDEAAELLISDLMIHHMDTITHMSESDFNQLYEHVAPYMIDEFMLWQGNDDLLNDCFAQVSSAQPETDPALIILNCIKSKLMDLHGIYFTT